MQYRLFGSTGFQCSILGLGGESALYRHSDLAVQIIARALELGVNYFDTAPLYKDSELNSELRRGHAVRARPDVHSH